MSDKGRQLMGARLAYLQATFEAITPAAWTEVIRKCVEDAEAGHSRAVRFLAEYLLGQENTMMIIVKFEDSEVKQDDDER